MLFDFNGGLQKYEEQHEKRFMSHCMTSDIYLLISIQKYK